MSERQCDYPQSIDDIPASHLSPAELGEQLKIYKELKLGSAAATLIGTVFITGSKIGEKLSENHLEYAISAETGAVGITLFLAGTFGMIMANARLHDLAETIKHKEH